VTKKKPKAKKKQPRIRDKKRAFLAALAITGSITESARAVKIDRSLHYDWLKLDPLYPARFADARAMGDDAMEDEVTYRANHGVFVPNVYQGLFRYPQEQYEITPAIPAGDWKDEKPVEAVPAVMGWRDVPGAAPIGTWVKSDALLMFRQRGAFAKYRQNFTEVTGKGGGPVASEITVTFVRPPKATE
jgi:hypothetical protein